MDRCAVFIDAGWLLSLAADAVTGRRRRDGVECDHAQLLAGVGALATDHTGLPLLRQYWYDARSEGSVGTEQQSIARLPGVKVRLAGSAPVDRRGVGTLLTLDLLRLAGRRAIASAVLIAGDEDLAESVAEAQALGAVVTVGRIETSAGRCGQSSRLVRESDDRLLIDAELLRRTLRPRVVPEPGGSAAGM
jgi:hypothetical protein